MQAADKGQQAPLDGRSLRIGVVQARFNEGVTTALLGACLTELAALGVTPDRIAHHTVPGARAGPPALRERAHLAG